MTLNKDDDSNVESCYVTSDARHPRVCLRKTRNGPFVSFCPFWPGFGLSGLVMAFLACFTLPFGCSFAGTFSAECDLVDACQ